MSKTLISDCNLKIHSPVRCWNRPGIIENLVNLKCQSYFLASQEVIFSEKNVAFW